MKILKQTFFVLAAAALAQSCTTTPSGEEGKLHITTNLKNTNDTVVVIVVDADKVQKGEKLYSDTVKATNGQIDVTIPLTHACNIALLNMKNGVPVGQMPFCGVPGEECQISGDWQAEYFLNGSKFYQQFNEIDQAITPIHREEVALVKECEARMAKGEVQEDIMKTYQLKAADIQMRMQNTQMEFIKKHPKNEACVTLLSELPADKALEAINMLSKSVKEGRMKPVVETVRKQAEKELARIEAAKSIKEGNVAPDFTLNDINGKPLKLSSLKGKYVVLDFWGSWCGWCIKGFPEMKNYYNKYKGKFEILGIDCGDTQDKWKEAVKKNELPWLHVFNPQDEGDITSTYAIQGYPTKIVVDPQGKIAKVVVGEDSAFYTYLDELFK